MGCMTERRYADFVLYCIFHIREIRIYDIYIGL